jgi:hypothetical protein
MVSGNPLQMQFSSSGLACQSSCSDHSAISMTLIFAIRLRRPYIDWDSPLCKQLGSTEQLFLSAAFKRTSNGPRAAVSMSQQQQALERIGWTGLEAPLSQHHLMLIVSRDLKRLCHKNRLASSCSDRFSQTESTATGT